MKTDKKRAQAALEMGFSLIGAFLLLWALIAIFMWVNNRLILRQEDYESSPEQGRVVAGSASGEVQVDESGYPPLDILEEGN